MAIKYVFREPLTIKNAKNADAQVIGETLDKVRAERGGRLTPRAVVESAKSANSPLHPHFEWDDARAAGLYREDQARSLIRSVRVLDERSERDHPAYFNIAEKGGHSYRSYSDVMSSRDLQLAARRAAKRDLDAFENRYQELVDICQLIRPAQRRLSDQIEAGEGQMAH